MRESRKPLHERDQVDRSFHLLARCLKPRMSNSCRVQLEICAFRHLGFIGELDIIEDKISVP